MIVTPRRSLGDRGHDRAGRDQRRARRWSPTCGPAPLGETGANRGSPVRQRSTRCAAWMLLTCGDKAAPNGGRSACHHRRGGAPGYGGQVSIGHSGGAEQCPACGESDLRPYGNGSKWACPRCHFILPCCEGGELAGPARVRNRPLTWVELRGFEPPDPLDANGALNPATLQLQDVPVRQRLFEWPR